MGYPTLSKMAEELNTFYKTNNKHIQYSVRNKKVVYIDYSIVLTRDKYGIEPIYCVIVPSANLRYKYNLLKRGLLG